MRQYLKKNYKIIQYVYSLLFLFIYTTCEIRGVNLKEEFQLKFKEWNHKNAGKNARKDLKTYQKRNKITEFEQIPVKIDLSDEEKKKLKKKKIEEKKLKQKKYTEKAKEERCLAKKAKNDKLENICRVDLQN